MALRRGGYVSIIAARQLSLISADMQMKMLPCASTLALTGMLALAHTDGGPRPASPRIEPLSRVTQYCVPPEDDPNPYRLYCWMEWLIGNV